APASRARPPRRGSVRRLLTREVATFLGVGGAGYVVDVAVFNVLRAAPPFAGFHPVVARTLAVAVAMAVTYLGNATLTWGDRAPRDRRREVGLFVVLNVVGLGFSVVALVVSHDLLGLTGRLADNVSANGVGLALGTVFRYLTYRRFVFVPAPPSPPSPPPSPPPGGAVRPRVPVGG
ncbi:MAG: GtrA family protein, partial [Nocardioidaceae bacterium]